MSIYHVNPICNRLSLRKPQRESLEILDRICEIIQLGKETDVATQLAAIQSEFAHVGGFDRDFASLCFAIATGVGIHNPAGHSERACGLDSKWCGFVTVSA